MSIRTLDILDCYTALEYNQPKFVEEIKSKNTLIDFINKYDIKSESDKLNLIKAVKHKIENNLPEFNQSEAHVDITKNILEYLDCISDILDDSTSVNNDEAIDGLLHTMQYLYSNEWIECLCKKLSIIKYDFQDFSEISIILLEDADLDAFLDSLRIFSFYCTTIHVKIWVQETIREKLTARFKEMLIPTIDNFQLCGFSQTKSLLTKLNITYDIISMWSENVALLKCLATSITAYNVLINSFHEFAAEPLVPITNKIEPPDEFFFTSDVLDTSLNTRIRHHFYGGEWKEPIEKLYTEDANKCAYAVATRTDAALCLKHALRGYDTWRSMSQSARIKCLRRLATNIRNDGNASLAEKILRWARQPRGLKGSVVQPADKTYELVTTRQPIGVIILFETSTDLLFLRLVQALIAGNAVVIYSHVTIDNTATFNEYCGMLPLSGFPANVVSHLLNCTHDNMVKACGSIKRSFFCFGHECYELYDSLEYTLMDLYYKKYTSPKRVYMPLA